MFLRDRLLNILLLAAGAISWGLLVWLFVTRSPRDDPEAQVLGAVVLGLCLGLTAAPLFWLAAFSRRRIAYRGSWLRAARRATWLGGAGTLYVLLRSQDAFSLPLALFVVALVVFVEVTLTVRR